ncbi:tyrosine-type recombinase/integrase [Thiotrichales bacterium 19S11-10]|nr:tyrosine-type recombinase/integrase [Thiotrichales bacterium 19S11-10]
MSKKSQNPLLIKPKNKDRRDREYLTEKEVNKLIITAKKFGRHGERDAAMILVAYRHGLRVAELVNLKWSQVDLPQGIMHVSRLKSGINSTHPISGIVIRSLRKMKRIYPDTDFVFVSERKSPLTDHTFRKILTRADIESGLKMNVHPHMLRHSTGFKLANDNIDTRTIQLYLGHSNIQNTVIYTQLASNAFQGIWKD